MIAPLHSPHSRQGTTDTNEKPDAESTRFFASLFLKLLQNNLILGTHNATSACLTRLSL